MPALRDDAVPAPGVSPASGAVAQDTVADVEALRAAARRTGLAVLATGVWPSQPGDPLPPVAGFIVSDFNPIVVETARRALTSYYGEPPSKGGSAQRDGEVTAVMLVSRHGDAVSARTVAAAVDAGERVGPLMFFQSVPNAVAGYVAARWGLTGPVAAISPVREPIDEGLAAAADLVADGDADRVLAVFVEVGGSPVAGAAGSPNSGIAALVGAAKVRES